MKLQSSFWLSVLCGWGLSAGAPLVNAQLAITEVMASASRSLGAEVVPTRPDYWELTNFGTNTLDLTDYRFHDEGNAGSADPSFLSGLQIARGESILFFQSTPGVGTNAAQIRSWWGEANLPAGLQIYAYTGRGFSAVRDAVQLWRVAGSSTTLVQRVELYEASRGRSLTYDLATGALDTFSELGETNTFQAVEADDVGSPGFTAGPVPLIITHQPQSVVVDGGAPATFSVQASGLPKARFQWRFNGVPIAGANSNIMEISAAQPLHAGSYTVELTNGLMNVTSTPAVLQVSINPSPPSIVIPPSALTVTPGQTAIFRVTARGFPISTNQWRFNGVDIPGATNTTLLVANAQFASAGVYSVHLQNMNGSTNAAAVLTVQPKPNLKITEMMGSTSTNSTVFGRADWWELTNFDTNAVNLRGYRFDDFPGVLEGAVVITNDVIIQPGQSVLFIQDMTPDLFTRWWGAENLPQDVTFVRYAGNGFTSTGDSVTLWNPTALAPNDFIDRAEYVHLNPDFSPVRGISLSFWCEGFIEFGEPSVTNLCGAIQAAGSADIGSPGFVINHPPRPLALQVSRDAQGVHLTWKTQAGVQYELLGKDDLLAPSWTPLGQHLAPNALLTITDATATNAARRFYQLRIVP